MGGQVVYEACFRVCLKHASLWAEVFKKLRLKGLLSCLHMYLSHTCRTAANRILRSASTIPTGRKTEQATTGVRKLVQIYNMCASVSACVSVTDLCYNFPQGNLAMKPTYQDCKTPMKPKNQDCKTHETKKTKKPKKKQDCKTHESSNLGTLGSDILFVCFFFFWVFLFFFVFLVFLAWVNSITPKCTKRLHCAPGLSSIWCLMDGAPQQKTVETTQE